MRGYSNKYANFSSLVGKTLTSIEGAEVESEGITFTAEDGSSYEMYHQQDCCEHVYVEDVIGDIEDLIGEPILQAEETASTDDPEDFKADTQYRESFTWTFYKLATRKGYVTIRWYGTSNGYYSESVNFFKK